MVQNKMESVCIRLTESIFKAYRLNFLTIGYNYFTDGNFKVKLSD